MTEKVKKQRGPNGGRRPGSGRKPGGKNKATIIRETKQAEVIAAMVDSGKPMAITVLQKAMEFAEGAVSAFRPTLDAELKAGAPKNPDGSKKEFGEWFDRWLKCITTMAEYQTAKIKPMEKPTAPPQPGENRRRFTLRVFDGGRQVKGPPPDEGAA